MTRIVSSCKRFAQCMKVRHFPLFAYRNLAFPGLSFEMNSLDMNASLTFCKTPELSINIFQCVMITKERCLVIDYVNSFTFSAYSRN